MKIKFIGVGEAFDYTLPTTCIGVESNDKVMLIDCGYAAPHPIWQTFPDAETIDYIYITHWHADHFFGLPALLTRWWEEDRKKEIVIIGQSGTEKATKDLLEMAYPGVFWDFAGKFTDQIGAKIESAEGGLKKPHFKITFIESDSSAFIGPFNLQFARTTHSRKNMAIRIEVQEKNHKKSFGFSGDGDFTEATKELFANIDLLAHETYLLDTKILGHGCVNDALSAAIAIGVKQLAMLHINRSVRKNSVKQIIDLIQEKTDRPMLPKDINDENFPTKLKVTIPEPGDNYEI